jgi:hypothetical protein
VKSETRSGRKDSLVSETMAPTLTVSAHSDTELGSLFQRRMPHLEDGHSTMARMPPYHGASVRADLQRHQPNASCCVATTRTPFGLIHLCCEIAMRQQN